MTTECLNCELSKYIDQFDEDWLANPALKEHSKHLWSILQDMVKGLVVPDITPTIGGGILLIFEKDQLFLEFELPDHKETLTVYFTNTTNPHARSIIWTFFKYNEIVDDVDLKEYLKKFCS